MRFIGNGKEVAGLPQLRLFTCPVSYLSGMDGFFPSMMVDPRTVMRVVVKFI